jgi:hypothetical protein
MPLEPAFGQEPYDVPPLSVADGIRVFRNLTLPHFLDGSALEIRCF